MKRLSNARLVELAGALSRRDRAIIETVARLRLTSSKQLERLCFATIANEPTRQRLVRRTLARLVERGVLGRLERRVGGVRAGAAGHVYYAAAAGQRLVAYWQGQGLTRTRSPHEPGAPFVRHTLAIAESYVDLVEADRQGDVELLGFESEPTCWRWFLGLGGARQWVKPDALVRLGVGEIETRSWLEVDCGTEGRSALVRKCHAYLAAYRAGVEHEVFPRIVWTCTSERRAALLREVCSELPAEAWRLFAVTTPPQMVELLSATAVSS